MGKIVRGTVAAWAIRAFTPVFDGLSGRLRPSSKGHQGVYARLRRATACTILPTRAIEQRAFAHPTRLTINGIAAGLRNSG